MRASNVVRPDEVQVKPNFIINDIALFIPPTSISIHKENLEYSFKTLRSRISTKIASGSGIYHAQISITFPPEGIIQLHRLICQVRNSPLVSIENEFITTSIVAPLRNTLQHNFFTVIGLNITSHPSSPGSFLVELDLRYFNHRPYGRNLFFKKDFLNIQRHTNKKIEFSHRVFPEANGLFSPTAIKVGEHTQARNQSSRNSNPESILTRGLASGYARVRKVGSALESNAYKRYSNFLQAKSLLDNWGLTIEIEGSSRGIVLCDSSIKDYFEKGKDGEVLGFHESPAINNSFTLELAKKLKEFQNDLVFKMLLNAQNTVIAGRDFVVLNLPKDVLKRYRESINNGITRGSQTEEAVLKKKQDNIRAINKFFSKTADAQIGQAEAAKRMRLQPTEKLIQGQEFTYPEIALKERNWSSLRIHRDIIFQNTGLEFEFFPVTSKPYYVHRDNYLEVRNIDRIDYEDPKKNVKPVFAVVDGLVTKISDKFVAIDDGVYGEVIYEDLTILPQIRDFYDSNIDIRKGDLLGFFDNADSIRLYANKEIRDGLTTSKPPRTTPNSTPQEDIATGIFKLTIDDIRLFNNIKKYFAEKSYMPYAERSGLENIFYGVAHLNLDNDYAIEDICRITGRDLETLPERYKGNPNQPFETRLTTVSCSLRNIVASIPII